MLGSNTILNKTTSLLTIVLLISACGLVPRVVPDSERVQSNIYDGNYSLEIQKFSGKQSVSGKVYTCNLKKHTTNMRVADGVISMNYQGNWFKTNVNAKGLFMLVVPTDRSYGRTSGVASSSSKISLIYKGNFSKIDRSGTFVLGRKGDANIGCTTKLKITKK